MIGARRMDGPSRGWRYIDLALLGSNTLRSYAVSLVRIILSPVLFIAVAWAAIFLLAARHWLPPAFVTGAVVATAFAAVIVAGMALAWSVARTHRRPWRSLIAADLRVDWRRLAIGAGVEAMLLLAFLSIPHLLTGQSWGIKPAMTRPSFVVVMLLIPFQAASEEMLFRGYLTQALGRIFRRRSTIVAIVGLVFGAMHFNAYGPLTVPYLFGLSVIFSIVSLRDERLELTIGAHAGMNWFAISAGALAAGHPDIRLNWAAFAALLLHGALFYGLTRLLVQRCCERSPAG